MKKIEIKQIQAIKEEVERIEKDVDKNYRKEIYRKLIHLSSLWIPTLIYFAHPGFSIFVFSTIFITDLFLEYGNYKRWRWARRAFGGVFFRILRTNERKRNTFQISGSVYVMSAAIACTLLFSKEIAIVALTTMLFADTTASLIGKAYGTRKIHKKKSLEGTMAFFITALFINVAYEPLYHFSYANVLACVLATLAEVYEDKFEIDDNLSIPLVVGITLSLLSA